MSGNLTSNSVPIERFEAHIRALLNRHAGNGAGRYLARLRIQEQVNPTGLVDDIVAAHHQAHRSEMLSVLRELLGAKTPDMVVNFYETCVLALCRGEWFNSDADKKRPANVEEIELLASRIKRFMLLGIKNKIHLMPANSPLINTRE